MELIHSPEHAQEKATVLKVEPRTVPKWSRTVEIIDPDGSVHHFKLSFSNLRDIFRRKLVPLEK